MLRESAGEITGSFFCPPVVSFTYNDCHPIRKDDKKFAISDNLEDVQASHSSLAKAVDDRTVLDVILTAQG